MGFIAVIKMMKNPEIAIISAAIQAYIDSGGATALSADESRLRTLIAAAVAAYEDMESATI